MSWLILLIVLLPSWSWGAVTVDTASSSTGTTSTSHSHTIAADANLVIVSVGIRDEDGTPNAISGVTVGGAAATLISGCERTSGSSVVRVEAWAKYQPATGSQTIAVTGHAETEQLTTGVVSLKGASGTFRACTTFSNASTTNVDVDSIASSTGELGVMALVMNATATCAADATAPVSTEQLEFSHTTNQTQCVYTEDGASSTIDMRADLGTARATVAVGVSVQASSGRRSVSPIILGFLLNMLGIGEVYAAETH
jgi:hypothetical protein